jgi:hypothetical protein
MVGFINTLYNQHVLTISYSAIANLHISQITRTCFILILVLLVLFCTPASASFGILLSYISSAGTTQHRKHNPAIVVEACYNAVA